MTKKETALAAMAEHKTAVENGVESWNKLVKAEEVDYEALKEVENAVNKAVEDYAKQAKTYAFETLIENATANNTNVFTEICKALHYNLVRVSVKKPKDMPTEQMAMMFVKTYIDPLDVEKYLGRSIACDKNWKNSIEGFNIRLTLWAANELKLTPEKITKINDSKTMKDFLKTAAETETKPYSNNQILNAMNAIIAGCIGEDYKGTSHDATWIKLAFTKVSKPKGSEKEDNTIEMLKLKGSKHRDMRVYFCNIMHNIIVTKETGSKCSGYDIDI